MNRVLFAWELGGNLGHLAKQQMIAHALRQRGHHCLFAARDVAVAAALLAGDGFDYVQAPFFCVPESEPSPLAGYSDILRVNGFGSPELLSGLVDAWLDLFGTYNPDLILADYSPTAVLAAKLAAIPLMRVDSGFGLPPDERPFPVFRPWLGIPAAEVLAAEQALLATVNAVCGRHGGVNFRSLQEMLTTDMDLLATVPELDQYQGRRFGNYIGPLFNLSVGRETVWPEQPGRRIFVYLRHFEGLETVLQTLAERSLSVIAVIPGIDPELARRYAGDRFLISVNPVRISDILSGTDIAVTHGGHGLASACLQFGVPMLLIPQVIEQLMTAANYERLGSGLGVNYDQVITGFAPALDRMLSDASFRECATLTAAKYSDYDQELVIRNLADTAEGLMRRKRVTSALPPGGTVLPLSCLPGHPAALLPFQ